MAYGLPAVVHSDRWTHMPEIAAFSNETTGRSFPPNEEAGLAAAVASLIDLPGTLDRMSAASLSTVRDGFNTSQMTERFLAAIRGLEKLAS